MRGPARAIDPRGGPVGAQLLLPDRQPPLHFLDDVAARLERLRPVRCRRGDRNARLADADRADAMAHRHPRSEEHTSELQSLAYLVCRLLLEKKKKPTRCRLGIALTRAPR